MRSAEKTAKTIEDAVNAALAELGIAREEAEIKVLEEPSKGLLGFLGGRPARVLVTEKEKEIEKTSDRVAKFLNEVLSRMDLTATVAAEEHEDLIQVDIRGEGLGVVIGKRGQTLDALQYLANIVANKGGERRQRIILDAEGYRKRREEVLVDLAGRLAERVRRSGESIVLEPMSAPERKVIHSTLQNHPFVTTHSQGEEPFRKIVILAKKETR